MICKHTWRLIDENSFLVCLDCGDAFIYQGKVSDEVLAEIRTEYCAEVCQWEGAHVCGYPSNGTKTQTPPEDEWPKCPDCGRETTQTDDHVFDGADFIAWWCEPCDKEVKRIPYNQDAGETHYPLIWPGGF